MVKNEIITETATESILTLAQAKKQLRIEAEFINDDDIIKDCIDAAQAAAANYMGRPIGTRTFVMECDQFETPLTFAISSNDVVSKVEYYPLGQTVAVELPADQYRVVKSALIDCLDIRFTAAPATDDRDDAVIITVTQGYASAACPKPIVQAMKLMLSDYYERREDRGEVGYNGAANNLLRPYRKY